MLKPQYEAHRNLFKLANQVESQDICRPVFVDKPSAAKLLYSLPCFQPSTFLPLSLVNNHVAVSFITDIAF